MTLANILRVDAHLHRRLPADSELCQAIAILARAHQDAIWRGAGVAPSCTTATYGRSCRDWSPKMDGIAATIWASQTTSSTSPLRQPRT